jgi:hypothetical protein
VIQAALVTLKEISALTGLGYQQLWRSIVQSSPTEGTLHLVGHDVPVVKQGWRWYCLRVNLGFLAIPTEPTRPLSERKPGRKPTSKRT